MKQTKKSQTTETTRNKTKQKQGHVTNNTNTKAINTKEQQTRTV